MCLETDFPYIPSNYFIAPPSKAYKDALVHCKGASYKRIQQDPTVFQKSLYSAKRPIVLGITLYSSFEADSTINSGLVPLPDTENEEVLGGHCVRYSMKVRGISLNDIFRSQSLVMRCEMENCISCSATHGEPKIHKRVNELDLPILPAIFSFQVIT